MADVSGTLAVAQVQHDAGSPVLTFEVFQDSRENTVNKMAPPTVCLSLRGDGAPGTPDWVKNMRLMFQQIVGFCDSSKGGWAQLTLKDGTFYRHHPDTPGPVRLHKPEEAKRTRKEGLDTAD